MALFENATYRRECGYNEPANQETGQRIGQGFTLLLTEGQPAPLAAQFRRRA
jgi:hypothetical protein